MPTGPCPIIEQPELALSGHRHRAVIQRLSTEFHCRSVGNRQRESVGESSVIQMGQLFKPLELGVGNLPVGIIDVILSLARLTGLHLPRCGHWQLRGFGWLWIGSAFTLVLNTHDCSPHRVFEGNLIQHSSIRRSTNRHDDSICYSISGRHRRTNLTAGCFAT